MLVVKVTAGVAATIKQLEGAIGYLNYGYVNGGKFQQVALQNKAGNFVKANSETSAAGLAKIVLDDKLRGADPNPAGANAYPIVSLTWILAYPESKTGVKETLRYMLSEKVARYFRCSGICTSPRVSSTEGSCCC